MESSLVIAILVFIIIILSLWIARGYKLLDKWLPAYFKCGCDEPPAPANKSGMVGGCGGCGGVSSSWGY